MYSFTLRFASIFLLGVAISSSRASGWWPSLETAADAPPPTERADEPKTVAPPKQDPKDADKPKTLAPPKQDPKAADQPKTLDKTKAAKKLQPKGRLKAKQDRKRKAEAARRAAAKKRRSKRGFEMNPDAKWACDQQTTTLEPVWRGARTLTFPFLIRNDGTADLRIRAKGG